jgi:type VI secretion system protein ImpH
MSTSAAVIAHLRQRPAHFALVSAIEVLERSRPGAAPVGHLGPVADEAVRLRPLLDLAFPSGDVTEVVEQDGRWQLTTPVLGLYGEGSPLPSVYTETLLQLDEPNAARALLDLINHRLLSFLYRAALKYRQRGTVHAVRFAALLGRDPLRPLDEAAAVMLACAGCLAQRSGGAAGLEAAMRWWFAGLPVMVETCVPCWTAIAPDQQARLGTANGCLGQDALLGAAIRNRGLTIRVEVRPRSRAELRFFLPGGRQRGRLLELIAVFNPGRLDVQLDLMVAAEVVPPGQLGADTRLAYDQRLGGSTAREHRIRLALVS